MQIKSLAKKIWKVPPLPFLTFTNIESKEQRSATCPIWYVNPSDTYLFWGFQCWKEWLRRWVLERITFQNMSGNEVCKCLSNDCNHMMTKQELIANLGKKDMEEIWDRFLKTYLSNVKDVRKWPNQDWDFAGIIKMKPCKELLQWDKWDTEWQDPSQKFSYSKTLYSFCL